MAKSIEQLKYNHHKIIMKCAEVVSEMQSIQTYSHHMYLADKLKTLSNESLIIASQLVPSSSSAN